MSKGYDQAGGCWYAVVLGSLDNIHGGDVFSRERIGRIGDEQTCLEAVSRGKREDVDLVEVVDVADV